MRELRPVAIERCIHCGEVATFWALGPSAGGILRWLVVVAPLAAISTVLLTASAAEHTDSPFGPKSRAAWYGIWGLVCAAAPVALVIAALFGGEERQSVCGRCGERRKLPEQSRERPAAFASGEKKVSGACRCGNIHFAHTAEGLAALIRRCKHS